MNWSDLHPSAFVLTIQPGRIDEYKRRHNEIWPEMRAALKASGILYYDIYLNEPASQVFGVVLRAWPADPTAPEDPVILRWRAYMSDVLVMEGDRPRRTPMERVFHLTA
jgi:L-rhamnose mutarotase